MSVIDTLISLMSLSATGLDADSIPSQAWDRTWGVSSSATLPAASTASLQSQPIQIDDERATSRGKKKSVRFASGPPQTREISPSVASLPDTISPFPFSSVVPIAVQTSIPPSIVSSSTPETQLAQQLDNLQRLHALQRYLSDSPYSVAIQTPSSSFVKLINSLPPEEENHPLSRPASFPSRSTGSQPKHTSSSVLAIGDRCTPPPAPATRAHWELPTASSAASLRALDFPRRSDLSPKSPIPDPPSQEFTSLTRTDQSTKLIIPSPTLPTSKSSPHIKDKLSCENTGSHPIAGHFSSSLRTQKPVRGDKQPILDEDAQKHFLDKVALMIQTSLDKYHSSSLHPTKKSRDTQLAEPSSTHLPSPPSTSTLALSQSSISSSSNTPGASALPPSKNLPTNLPREVLIELVKKAEVNLKEEEDAVMCMKEGLIASVKHLIDDTLRVLEVNGQIHEADDTRKTRDNLKSLTIDALRNVNFRKRAVTHVQQAVAILRDSVGYYEKQRTELEKKQMEDVYRLQTKLLATHPTLRDRVSDLDQLWMDVRKEHSQPLSNGDDTMNDPRDQRGTGEFQCNHESQSRNRKPVTVRRVLTKLVTLSSSSTSALSLSSSSSSATSSASEIAPTSSTPSTRSLTKGGTPAIANAVNSIDIGDSEDGRMTDEELAMAVCNVTDMEALLQYGQAQEDEQTRRSQQKPQPDPSLQHIKQKCLRNNTTTDVPTVPIPPGALLAIALADEDLAPIIKDIAALQKKRKIRSMEHAEHMRLARAEAEKRVELFQLAMNERLKEREREGEDELLDVSERFKKETQALVLERTREAADVCASLGELDSRRIEQAREYVNESGKVPATCIVTLHNELMSLMKKIKEVNNVISIPPTIH